MRGNALVIVNSFAKVHVQEVVLAPALVAVEVDVLITAVELAVDAGDAVQIVTKTCPIIQVVMVGAVGYVLIAQVVVKESAEEDVRQVVILPATDLVNRLVKVVADIHATEHVIVVVFNLCYK